MKQSELSKWGYKVQKAIHMLIGEAELLRGRVDVNLG